MRFEYTMVGAEGFEPSEWWSQSPLPYHLATPQYQQITLYHIIQGLSIGFWKKFKKIFPSVLLTKIEPLIHKFARYTNIFFGAPVQPLPKTRRLQRRKYFLRRFWRNSVTFPEISCLYRGRPNHKYACPCCESLDIRNDNVYISKKMSKFALYILTIRRFCSMI